MSPHYGKAPIVEATIAVTFSPLPLEQLATLTKIGSLAEDRYPFKNARFHSQLQVQVGAAPGTSSQQYQDGFIFFNSERTRAVQYSLSSFVFSMMHPYSCWEDFYEEARRLWDAATSLIKLEPTRIGVRYINKLEMPLGEPIEEYLTTYPEISRELPQLLNQYYMRLELPVAEGTLFMQQGFVPASSPELGAVLLDNDFQHEVTEPGTIWDRIAAMRTEKNTVFEACITERMRERIR